MIAIIDYGVGNLFSLAHSLKHIGTEAAVTSDEGLIRSADHVILPGDETPKLPKEAETPEKEAENRPETPPDAPAGEMDRWLSCADTAAMTNDEVLMPLLSRLDGVLYRYRSGGIELAVPAEAAEAISAVLCLTRDERIRDRDYFVVSLNRSGSPAPAMQSSTY